MMYRALLHLFLLLVMSAAVLAQPESEKPVTLSELRGILTRAETDQALIQRTNNELIAAIKTRGVDFVLTPEEEWALKMREASDELIAAIREAIDPTERDFKLNVRKQQNLYTAFATNFNRPDLAARQTALTAAREFVGTYSTDPNVAEIVAFMKQNLPRLEQSVAMLQQRESAIQQAQAQNVERELQREQQRAERDAQRAERDRQRQEARAAGATPIQGRAEGELIPVNPSERIRRIPQPRPVFPPRQKPDQ